MDPYLGSVLLFAGNFPPRGWAFCQGQLMPISQNTALFSLLGTYYGGDGRTTFALPDLRGRAILSSGQGPGLSPRSVGEQGGTETTTLTTLQMPVHTHPVAVSITPGAASSANNASPVSNVYGTSGSKKLYTSNGNVNMLSYQGTLTMQPTGGTQPFSNLHPELTLNYIIALQGVFPQRP
ncbi:MAG: tail fiber protein [Chitinophagaceae bacterium]